MPVGVAANDDAPPSFFPLQARWATDLGPRAAAAPGHNDTLVFVSLRSGRLVAVRIDDGTVAWTAGHVIRFSPVTLDGLVIVATEGVLRGLRESDGATVWTTELGAPISTQPLLESGWLVVTLDGGEVVALRGADGLEFWREQLSGSFDVPPSIGGPGLFVPITDGRIVALELTTGRRLWDYRLRGEPQRILALDALFVGSTDNFMYRLSRKDGRVEWRWRTGADIVGLPAVDETRVFFVSLDNVLRALDRKSGVQQWRRALSGRPTGGPQIVGEMVLVSGVAPELRAFDTSTGAPVGVLQAPGEFAMPPHVIRPPSPLAPGLIVTTGDGRLAVMRRPTGPPSFSMSFPPPPLLPVPEPLSPEAALRLWPLRGEPLRVVPALVLPFVPLPLPEAELVSDPSITGAQPGALDPDTP